MITFDGERSKGKLWFAKKKLATIKELDIPSASPILDGFNIKVWQQGDLSGGRITAPQGLVVICSSLGETKIAVFENYLGSCNLAGNYYVMFNPDYRVSVSGLTKEEMIANGLQTIMCKSVVEQSYCDNGVDEPFIVNSHPCTPSVFPFKGAEAFSVTITDKIFLDLNNNGLPDYPYPLLDSSLVPYSSNGNFLGGRRTNSIASGANDMRKTCVNFPDGSQLAFPEGYFDVIDGQFVCADIIESGAISQIFLSDMVPEYPEGSLMPPELRTLMLNLDISIIRPCGFYSFTSSAGERVLVMAAFFDPLAVPVGGPDSTISNYFSSHPGDEHWRAFLSVMIGNVIHLIHSDQFYSLLQSLAINSLEITGVVQWERVGDMLKYIFPYPNLPGLKSLYFAWKPHDSVMFHGADDAVYTWARSIGGLKFDNTGISTATIYVPDIVTSNPGTRPDITHAGNGLYICVCNDILNGESAAYYGSPFVGWTALPSPPDGCVLPYIRPIYADGANIVLVGIAKQSVPDIGERYRFSFIDFSYGEEVWRIAGTVPFDVTDNDNFSVGLYGIGPMVNMMNTYLSPPPSVPQNIVVPYDGYAMWRP